jgi:hypothetical protein
LLEALEFRADLLDFVTELSGVFCIKIKEGFGQMGARVG